MKDTINYMNLRVNKSELDVINEKTHILTTTRLIPVGFAMA